MTLDLPILRQGQFGHLDFCMGKQAQKIVLYSVVACNIKVDLCNQLIGF